MGSLTKLTILLVSWVLTVAKPPVCEKDYLINAYKDLKQQIQNCTGDLLCEIVTFDKGLFGNSVKCIPKNQICDHKLDCVLGEDEVGCAPKCSGIRCQDEKNCATPCDQNTECEGGEDERGCQATCACPKGSYRCADGRTCIPRSRVCDGRDDCPGGDDEIPCPNNCNCPEGNMRCGDGVTCIPKSKVCDGQMDCPGNDDELNCPFGCRCRPNQFICLNGNKCLARSDVCNSIPGECCDNPLQCQGALNEEEGCIGVTGGG